MAVSLYVNNDMLRAERKVGCANNETQHYLIIYKFTSEKSRDGKAF